MVFNKVRNAIYQNMLEEYTGEEAETQVANSNVMQSFEDESIYTIIFDNGLSDNYKIINGVAELVTYK